jgi:hypothetical protein
MRPEGLSNHPLDESIRVAFEPSPLRVRQLTDAALNENLSSTRTHVDYLAVFASAVVACLFVVSVLLLPGPRPEFSEPATTVHRRSIVISNTNGLVTAETASGQIIVMVSGGAS